MKRKLLVALTVASIVGIALAQTVQSRVRLGWVLAPADEGVTSYVVEYAPRGASNWTAVVVPGSQSNVVLDVTPWGTRFRMYAENAWGRSQPTDVAVLPSRIVFTISAGE